MREIRLNGRRLFQALGLAAAIIVWPVSATTGPLDSLPLDPAAKVLQSSTLVVPANGVGADLFVPARGRLTLDFAVQKGNELRLTVLTGEQYSDIQKGKKPSGSPVLVKQVRGVASESVTLGRGTYLVYFGQGDSPNIGLTYRAHFRIE
jgi:hypothetical protein